MLIITRGIIEEHVQRATLFSVENPTCYMYLHVSAHVLMHVYCTQVARDRAVEEITSLKQQIQDGESSRRIHNVNNVHGKVYIGLWYRPANYTALET